MRDAGGARAQQALDRGPVGEVAVRAADPVHGPSACGEHGGKVTAEEAVAADDQVGLRSGGHCDTRRL